MSDRNREKEREKEGESYGAAGWGGWRQVVYSNVVDAAVAA